MDKHAVLTGISRLSAAGELKKHEVLRALRSSKRSGEAGRIGIADILYAIGALIVLIGIVILITDNWDALPTPARILVTLGSGTAAHVSALLLMRDQRSGNLPKAFVILAAALIPIGLYVMFYEAGFDVGGNGVHSLISAVLTATFFASYAVLKADVYLAFGIFFATWFYFAFLSFIGFGAPFMEDWRLRAYEVFALGAAYVAFGHACEKLKPNFAGTMYILGTFGFLAAALALGGWSPSQAVFWELTYPAYIAAAIFLSVRTHRSGILYLSALFLMGYILKITGEYFGNSIGWAASLVVVGFLLIGVGYATYTINRRYLVKT